MVEARDLLDVRARGKGAPRARDDRAPDRGLALDARSQGIELAEQRHRERVQRLGPVQRDLRDAVGDGQLHERHRSYDTSTPTMARSVSGGVRCRNSPAGSLSGFWVWIARKSPISTGTICSEEIFGYNTCAMRVPSREPPTEIMWAFLPKPVMPISAD